MSCQTVYQAVKTAPPQIQHYKVCVCLQPMKTSMIIIKKSHILT